MCMMKLFQLFLTERVSKPPMQIPILLTPPIWYLSDMSFDKSAKVLEKWSVNYPIIGETRCHRAVRHKQMISAISN